MIFKCLQITKHMDGGSPWLPQVQWEGVDPYLAPASWRYFVFTAGSNYRLSRHI